MVQHGWVHRYAHPEPARGAARRRRAASGASPTHRLVTANPSPPALREALLQGLHDMGYVEGQNLIIEFRHGEGNAAMLPP